MSAYGETEAQEARAKTVELRAEAARFKRELDSRGDGREPDPDGEPPSETPTTFGDCAALYHQASAAYTAAATAYKAGDSSGGNAHMSHGADLEASADSCMHSAKGETIEL